MEREALKLALETLQFYASVCNEDDQLTPAKTAIAKCKAALAQPAQEQWKCVGPPCKCNASNAKQCCYAVFTTPPAQEPEMLTIAYQSGYYDGRKAALAGREWNFCERCGKRTADKTAIHTCTPPQEKNA